MDAESTESTQSTELYLKVLAWLHANQKKLVIAGVVVIVIAAIMSYMSWQKSATDADANAHLLGVPLATLQNGQMTPTSPTPFLDVAKQFPDTSSGEYAQLIGAERLFTDGKYADAHQEFSKFIETYPTSSLIAQAKVGIAACLEGEGKISESAQKYQELISTYPSDANIVSPAKLTLARLYEELKKPEQALTFYSELARINNPYDPWVAEARERGEMLLARHPELRKAPPGSGPATGLPPGALAPQPGHVSLPGGTPPTSGMKPVVPTSAPPKPQP